MELSWSVLWSAQGFGEKPAGRKGIQKGEHGGHMDIVSDHPGII